MSFSNLRLLKIDQLHRMNPDDLKPLLAVRVFLDDPGKHFSFRANSAKTQSPF